MVGCLGVKQPNGMIQEDLLTGLQHVRQDVGSGPQEIICFNIMPSTWNQEEYEAGQEGGVKTGGVWFRNLVF